LSATTATELPVPPGTRRSRRDVVNVAAHYVAYLLVAVVMAFPMYWIVHVALSQPGNEFAYPPGFLPHPTLFGNFAHAIAGSAGVGSVWPFFRNSVMYAVLATAGCLIMQCIVGFGFARYEFPGRRILFALTVSMMMLPFVVTLIPRFVIFRDLQLNNTLWPLIIPWWLGGSPYGIFLMRQFFMSIPTDLDEAARLDGMGGWRILWTVLVPQAVPVLIALGLIEFSYFWNDLLGPLIYTQTANWQPMSLGVWAEWRQGPSVLYPYFMALVVLMVVPLFVIFLIVQRRFRQGFLYSGLGGR
jgi:ABC-type glycerol-3-phosphate transport system permease component